jgi:hypothetical protein
MMTAILTRTSERVVANDLRQDGGYKPELKRTLSSFQMFAISFASVSVVIGVFSTYDDVLRNSGPVGLWLFPIVAVGQILVALVYAQFAARIPLTARPTSGLHGWPTRRSAGCSVGSRYGIWDSALSRSTMRWQANA